ncbi:TIGR02186 family protein [Phaeobacter sp. J2-8]|uniref:TIGR02186 family protein n=1 Tax=Phaeobacter sp. J2-8 TaxID=2931394 RepID=UPI0032AF677B
MVRKKERRYGIWINTESADLHSAPSFYSVSSSRPLKDILPEAVDEEFQITAPQMVQGLGSEQNFVDATIRIRENAGLYQVNEGSIEVSEQTLFRTSVDMPANLTEGDYRTRVFLLRDQTIISDFETIIDVRKVGLERFLFNLSRERPLIYGLLSLAIAIAAGWGASAAFRVFKAG